MLRSFICCVPLLLASGASVADDTSKDATPAPKVPASAEEPKADASKAKEASAEGGVKQVSGMSILGNQDAPKSLVIVPWKSSEIGDMSGFSRLLDDSTRPVDKEVFMRELTYYQIRSN